MLQLHLPCNFVGPIYFYSCCRNMALRMPITLIIKRVTTNQPSHSQPCEHQVYLCDFSSSPPVILPSTSRVLQASVVGDNSSRNSGSSSSPCIEGTSGHVQQNFEIGDSGSSPVVCNKEMPECAVVLKDILKDKETLEQWKIEHEQISATRNNGEEMSGCVEQNSAREEMPKCTVVLKDICRYQEILKWWNVKDAPRSDQVMSSETEIAQIDRETNQTVIEAELSESDSSRSPKQLSKEPQDDIAAQMLLCKPSQQNGKIHTKLLHTNDATSRSTCKETMTILEHAEISDTDSTASLATSSANMPVLEPEFLPGSYYQENQVQTVSLEITSTNDHDNSARNDNDCTDETLHRNSHMNANPKSAEVKDEQAKTGEEPKTGEEVMDKQPKSADIVDGQPQSAEVVDEQPENAEVTCEQIKTAEEVMDEQPESSEKVNDEQPNSAEVLHEQPKSEVLDEQRKTAEEVVDDYPKSAEVMDKQPQSIEVTNEQSKSAEVVHEQPKSIKVTDEQPKSVEGMDKHPKSAGNVQGMNIEASRVSNTVQCPASGQKVDKLISETLADFVNADTTHQDDCSETSGRVHEEDETLSPTECLKNAEHENTEDIQEETSATFSHKDIVSTDEQENTEDESLMTVPLILPIPSSRLRLQNLNTHLLDCPVFVAIPKEISVQKNLVWGTIVIIPVNVFPVNSTKAITDSIRAIVVDMNDDRVAICTDVTPLDEHDPLKVNSQGTNEGDDTSGSQILWEEHDYDAKDDNERCGELMNSLHCPVVVLKDILKDEELLKQWNVTLQGTGQYHKNENGITEKTPRKRGRSKKDASATSNATHNKNTNNRKDKSPEKHDSAEPTSKLQRTHNNRNNSPEQNGNTVTPKPRMKRGCKRKSDPSRNPTSKSENNINFVAKPTLKINFQPNMMFIDSSAKQPRSDMQKLQRTHNNRNNSPEQNGNTVTPKPRMKRGYKRKSDPSRNPTSKSANNINFFAKPTLKINFQPNMMLIDSFAKQPRSDMQKLQRTHNNRNNSPEQNGNTVTPKPRMKRGCKRKSDPSRNPTSKSENNINFFAKPSLKINFQPNMKFIDSSAKQPRSEIPEELCQIFMQSPSKIPSVNAPLLTTLLSPVHDEKHDQSDNQQVVQKRKSATKNIPCYGCNQFKKSCSCHLDKQSHSKTPQSEGRAPGCQQTFRENTLSTAMSSECYCKYCEESQILQSQERVSLSIMTAQENISLGTKASCTPSPSIRSPAKAPEVNLQLRMPLQECRPSPSQVRASSTSPHFVPSGLPQLYPGNVHAFTRPHEEGLHVRIPENLPPKGNTPQLPSPGSYSRFPRRGQETLSPRNPANVPPRFPFQRISPQTFPRPSPKSHPTRSTENLPQSFHNGVQPRFLKANASQFPLQQHQGFQPSRVPPFPMDTNLPVRHYPLPTCPPNMFSFPEKSPQARWNQFYRNTHCGRMHHPNFPHQYTPQTMPSGCIPQHSSNKKSQQQMEIHQRILHASMDKTLRGPVEHGLRAFLRGMPQPREDQNMHVNPTQENPRQDQNVNSHHKEPMPTSAQNADLVENHGHLDQSALPVSAEITFPNTQSFLKDSSANTKKKKKASPKSSESTEKQADILPVAPVTEQDTDTRLAQPQDANTKKTQPQITIAEVRPQDMNTTEVQPQDLNTTGVQQDTNIYGTLSQGLNSSNVQSQGTNSVETQTEDINCVKEEFETDTTAMQTQVANTAQEGQLQDVNMTEKEQPLGARHTNNMDLEDLNATGAAWMEVKEEPQATSSMELQMHDEHIMEQTQSRCRTITEKEYQRMKAEEEEPHDEIAPVRPIIKIVPDESYSGMPVLNHVESITWPVFNWGITDYSTHAHIDDVQMFSITQKESREITLPNILSADTAVNPHPSPNSQPENLNAIAANNQLQNPNMTHLQDLESFSESSLPASSALRKPEHHRNHGGSSSSSQVKQPVNPFPSSKS